MKENIKLVIGGVISAFLVWFGFYLTSKNEEEKEANRKIDVIYTFAITQSLRDSLQSYQITELAARMNLHQKETNDAILNIQQSMLASAKQLLQDEKNN